jgi:hypothetical protein
LTPSPIRYLAPGVTLAKGLLVGPLTSLVLPRCSPEVDGRRVDRRSPVKPHGLGQQLRSTAAIGECEPGQLLRGIAPAAAENHGTQHHQHANPERRYPRDPHCRKAGRYDSRRSLHDERSVPQYPILGVGEFLPEAAGRRVHLYPNRVRVSAVPRPELEGENPQTARDRRSRHPASWCRPGRRCRRLARSSLTM